MLLNWVINEIYPAPTVTQISSDVSSHMTLYFNSTASPDGAAYTRRGKSGKGRFI